MSVSKALEISARDFCIKYVCNFDFLAFESRVEEFTFLRPNHGWIDVYKAVFADMYRKALAAACVGKNDKLDGEAMLDDFEYTLMRPYAKENESEIKHKPYVGMDRIARLEYLDSLTRQAPSNPAELYTERYKSGEISARQIRSALDFGKGGRDSSLDVVGYVQALESVNKGRSFMWRTFHPFKNSAEKRNAVLLRRTFIEKVQGGEEAYERAERETRLTFDGHKRVKERLAVSMLHAKEELKRVQKMSDVMRESIGAESFGGM